MSKYSKKNNIITLTVTLIHYVKLKVKIIYKLGARCCSVVRAFAHGAMGHRIDPSWSGPNELFLVPASAPQVV